MYTWPEEVDRIGKREEVFDGYGYQKNEVGGLDAGDRKKWEEMRRAKPFVIIEYGHAMGNGPGGILEYQKLFEKYERLEGGFIWEFIDHGIKQVDSNGKTFYAYGGDFGESRGTHGANFVCDGLLFPDRTPSPALHDVKKIFQPVVFSLEREQLVVRSRYDLRDLPHLRFVWKTEKFGVRVEGGKLDVPTVRARESVSVAIPQAIPKVPGAADGGYWWTVSALIDGASWADDGHEVAWEQFPCISPESPSKGFAPSHPTRAYKVDSKTIRVGPAFFKPTFGNLLTLGHLEIEQPQLDLWRAPTDNDNGGPVSAEWPEIQVPTSRQWLDAGFDRIQHRVNRVEVVDDTLIVNVTVGAAVLDRYLDTTYTYSGLDDGKALKISVARLRTAHVAS